ncbi:MAG: FAD-dependent oxidoreductase, partial [Actinobacteria bacterium]|nr:FAD-dependent oxidoreductase [Actinomycetota bacterium]
MSAGASLGQRAAFDLLVIGSGPSGQKAAIAAAKLGYRAAVVERSASPGGVSVHTGTIPSKAMREAVVHLTGLSQRELYGQSYRVKDEITVQDLLHRTDHVVRKEADIVRDQLARNGVTVFLGTVFRFGEHVTAVERYDHQAMAVLASGKRIPADVVLFSAGRQGATDTLALDQAGLVPDGRGRLEVNAFYQTAVPHIYAVGDVVGFPALASTSMEQGRIAAHHAFGEPVAPLSA